MEAPYANPIEVNGENDPLKLPKDNGRIIKDDKTEKESNVIKKYGVASEQEMLKQKKALQTGTEITKGSYDWEAGKKQIQITNVTVKYQPNKPNKKAPDKYKLWNFLWEDAGGFKSNKYFGLLWHFLPWVLSAWAPR